MTSLRSGCSARHRRPPASNEYLSGLKQRPTATIGPISYLWPHIGMVAADLRPGHLRNWNRNGNEPEPATTTAQRRRLEKTEAAAFNTFTETTTAVNSNSTVYICNLGGYANKHIKTKLEQRAQAKKTRNEKSHDTNKIEHAGFKTNVHC